MADIYRSDIVRVDLDNALLRKHVGSILVTGDKLGNRFGAEVYRDGKPVDVTGCGVTAYFMRSGEDTIILAGSANGSVAYVDLEQACYSKASSFTLTIKISYGGSTTALRVIDGYILLTQTDDLVDPVDAVPTLDDIFAQIAAMEAAANNANAAAINAVNIATEKGNQAIQLAQEEADKQNEKIAALTEDIARDTAPPIIPTATGDGAVSVSDSANRPLHGLTLYGKTTQDGTPTPDAPVLMVSAGESGTIGVQACGKNLAFKRLDRASIFADGYISAHNDYCMYVAKASPGTTVIFSTDGTENQTVAGFFVDEPAIGSRSYDNGRVDIPYITGITMPDDANYVAFRTSQDATYGQIELGTTATAYEPYKPGGSVTAQTPGGLNSIPASNTRDAVDLSWGKRVQKTVKMVLDGTENIENAWTTSQEPDQVTYKLNVGLTNNIGACSHFPNTALSPYPESASQGIEVYGYYIYFRWQEKFNTLPDFKAYLAAQYAAGMPVTVLYGLGEPIETPLTAAELAQYAAMMSQYPNTTVINDAGCGMNVDYVADTKLYIGNKLSALAAAIVNK